MNYENYNYKINDAWEILFDKFNIAEEVEKYGSFKIDAKEIRKYKEPRLMSKWDASKQIPKKLKDNKINILPISRNSYILGNFDIYKKLPEFVDQNENITYVNLPELETVDIDQITTEANAINVLVLSEILDSFFNTDKNYATFNGRMGTGDFDFKVECNNKDKEPVNVHVESAQCEIDGGFENLDSVVILEAKNVVNEDFNVRQLYYPYRLWRKRVNKPIRLVFSIYANKIFRLFEYKFEEEDNISSITKIREHMYSLEDINITWEDLIGVYENTEFLFTDKENESTTPFIQADSMDRIISLLENLYDEPLTKRQIAKELMDFTERQSDYYFNAGKYLGLFEKYSDQNNKQKIRLTDIGNNIYKLSYKERQLKIVELIFHHQLFKELFEMIIETGEMPSRIDIENKLRDLEVCNESLIQRRSSTVRSWLLWILKLIRF